MNFVSQNILLYCTHLYDDVSCDSMEAQMRRATPCLRPGAAATLCWSSHEEIPNVQGKRNPSNMVGTERGIRGQTDWNHNHRQLANLITQTTALSNSMKLSHAMWDCQDGRVMVERSDRMWSTGEGNGKPLQYPCLENLVNSMKRQNDRILKGELLRMVSAQYATGDRWRNNSRKNEGIEPKQKQYPVVDVTGDRSKV